MAYARILKSEEEFDPVVIGRVIISGRARGEKLGYQLMEKRWTHARNSGRTRRYTGAQAHLQSFYGHFGFTPVTDIYDEDGIPHIGMALEAKQAQ